MEYTKKLVLAVKEYLRSSTCNCGYKNNYCPQVRLQSLVDEYNPSPIVITKKKKGAK
jgi:hypothetical protein